MIAINWTPEKREQIIAMLDAWIKKHNAWGGEKIMQDDDCQIESSWLISDMVDDVIKPEIIEGDYDDE